MNRRKFLSLSALFAAPAIVKADCLMSIWIPPEKKLLGAINVYAGDFHTLKVVPSKTPLADKAGITETELQRMLHECWRLERHPSVLYCDNGVIKGFG